MRPLGPEPFPPAAARRVRAPACGWSARRAAACPWARSARGRQRGRGHGLAGDRGPEPRGLVAAGAGAAAQPERRAMPPPLASTIATTLPLLTLSPSLTSTSFTTPACEGGNLHRGLVALDGDQALLDLDAVARLDEDLDHADFGEIADVGHTHLDGAAGGGGCRPFALSRRRGRGGRTPGRQAQPRMRPRGLEQQHHRAFADLVAQRDLQFLHHAGVRRGSPSRPCRFPP